MTDRIYDLRLTTTYEGSDNKIATLDTEIQVDDEWHELIIDKLSPGFLLLNYGLSSCQHLYFRVNAAECDLILDKSVGLIHTVADEDWHIEQLDIRFDGVLRSGDVQQSHIDYITERMGHCPVSSNLIEPAHHTTRIHIHSPS